jgi:hypothetical protein
LFEEINRLVPLVEFVDVAPENLAPLTKLAEL